MNADNTMKTTAKPLKHDWTRFYALSEALGDGAATRLERPFLIGLSSKSADISIPIIAT